MTTLTETITKELLAAAGDLAAIESVLHQHSTSKGPLYTGLAQATTTLTEKLTAVSQKLAGMQKGLQERQQQVEIAEQRLVDLDKTVIEKTQELASVEERVKDQMLLLDGAREIRGLGFGPDELTRLRDILTQSVATQPAEAVVVFFRAVDNYQTMASLEMEIKRTEVAMSTAKAEMERWQAEAKTAEAKAKARMVSVDFADRLLAQGVKEPDLPRWTRIISRAGLKPESLSQALEEYGSLEKLCQSRQEQQERLEKRISELTSQVTALINERDRVIAAILAVRDKALAAVEQTSKETLANLEALRGEAMKYGELERKAGELGDELVIAHALKNQQWENIPREVIRNMFIGALFWTKADTSHNPTLPSLSRMLSNSSYYSQIRLDEVITLALCGLLTEEERKLLSGR